MDDFPAKSDWQSSKLTALTMPSLRILAIDYGRRRIGLAISDELALTARPLSVLLRRNRQEDLKLLRDICRRNSVTHIVVGYPLHITGEAGDMAAEAAQFAARLSRAVGIETELVDERLTSWEARQTLAETKTRAKASRRHVDDFAAAILLRDYLERRQQPQRPLDAEQD